MRCADLGPTPGKQRKESISSSSADGVFMFAILTVMEISCVQSFEFGTSFSEWQRQNDYSAWLLSRHAWNTLLVLPPGMALLAIQSG